MLKDKLTKHLVRLCRPRFETAVIEIQAEDEDNAEKRALELVAEDDAPEDIWRLQPFDWAAYTPHVEEVLSVEIVDEQAGGDLATKLDRIDEFRAGGPDEEEPTTRYLLLQADTYAGDGKLVLQPWFESEKPQLLEYDLMTDWMAQIAKVQNKY